MMRNKVAHTIPRRQRAALALETIKSAADIGRDDGEKRLMFAIFQQAVDDLVSHLNHCDRENSSGELLSYAPNEAYRYLMSQKIVHLELIRVESEWARMKLRQFRVLDLQSNVITAEEVVAV